MSLSSTAIRRPVSIMMLFIGITVLGVIAFQNLAVDFLPPIKIPKLTIQTTYPDVSPEEIEHTVTQPIESQLGTVTGVKRTSSVTREGVSIITAEFYWGTNMDFALLEVREKLDQVRSALPREAGRPNILKVDPSTEPVMTIAVSEATVEGRRKTGDGGESPERARFSGESKGRGGENEAATAHLVELKETARALIKRRIEQVEGVAQAAVLGGLEREIRVEIDTRILQSLSLTLDHVSSALAAANLSLPGGTIKSGLFRYSLRTVGEYRTVDEIRKTVVAKIGAGRMVRVSDIGTVTDSFKERSGLTRFDGREIIAIQVRKESGTNTVQVSQKVHAVLQTLRTEYPQLKLDVMTDQAEFISKSISDVEQAIIIGAILAFLVLFFFLKGIRYPIIIGLCMPVSILTTFIAMYFLRVNLNIISLTGLAIGIGMLGDNAIVVIENVTRLREKGMPLLDAAIEGSREINLAVTASTLTNVAIFLPIIFVEGVASQLFLDMGVTMTISLLASLLVAVTLVPMLVSREITIASDTFSAIRYLTNAISKKRNLLLRIGFWIFFPFRVIVVAIIAVYYLVLKLFHRWASTVSPFFTDVVDRVSHSTTMSLERYLNWAVLHRGLVIFTTIGIFLVSILVSLFVRSEPAPDIDQSRFSIQLVMPKGTSLDGTSGFAAGLEQAVLKLPDVKGVYASVGITDEQNYWSVSNAALERAELEVKVIDETKTDAVIEQVRSVIGDLGKGVSGVHYAVRKRGTTFEQILRPEVNDVKLRVIGRDPAVAFRIAEECFGRVKGIEGLVDVQTGLQKGSPEYRIVIDRERAANYGLSVRTIAQVIAQQMQGKEATLLSDFDRKIVIRVQPLADQRESIEDLLSSTVSFGTTTVPVRELVSWTKTEGYSEIWRENQQRVVLMTANVSGRSVNSVVSDVEENISALALPPGYRISVGGENEEIRDSFRSLLIIIVLSMFLVYMILAAEYESILYPLVIILTSPLAFIGAIFAMVIAGQNYNVMSLIGIVIMIGAVDNDAVIAVDIITLLRREGTGLLDAVKEGMKKRLRPILMTTVTTVMGVVPLIFEFGTGSELVRALTIPLVGGLIASTLFTIVAIPIVYTYIDRWAMGKR